MRPDRQHIILCEGFDDRSFWAGWLLHLDCRDPSEGGRITVEDKWGRPIRGQGRFAFTTPSDSCIVVHPFGGRQNLRRALRDYVVGQAYRPDRIILNIDSDSENGPGNARKSIDDAVAEVGEVKQTPDGQEIGGIPIESVIWECAQQPGLGAPRKQTLERLVSTAIEKAYPSRGSAVGSWLAAAPLQPETTPKNYTYSYLAKWYASHGADDFFRELWRDEATNLELQKLLEETGAWQRVVEMIAE